MTKLPPALVTLPERIAAAELQLKMSLAEIRSFIRAGKLNLTADQLSKLESLESSVDAVCRQADEWIEGVIAAEAARKPAPPPQPAAATEDQAPAEAQPAAPANPAATETTPG